MCEREINRFFLLADVVLLMMMSVSSGCSSSYHLRNNLHTEKVASVWDQCDTEETSEWKSAPIALLRVL